MNGVQFFNSPEVSLPLTRQTDDFEAFIKEVFDKYLKLIREMSTDDEITTAIKEDLPRIGELCESILKAIVSINKGLPEQAYKRVNEGISAVRTRLEKLIIHESQPHPQLKEMWRIRVAGPEGIAFQKKDLFHIPFEKRHLVTRQRYSIPGLPCLYLGGTLYVCWEELGRPSFESLYLARFSIAPTENVRLLDFAARPRWVAQTIQHSRTSQDVRRDFCVAHANCWPLIAASSVRRKYANAPFMSEYIVPQLLLQWVTQKDEVDGIAYFSVNLEGISNPPLSTANIVFPVSEITPEGTCRKLRQKFTMSEPAAWQLIANNPVAIGPTVAGVNRDMQVELVRGRPIAYYVSQFGEVEGKMLQLECSTF